MELRLFFMAIFVLLAMCPSARAEEGLSVQESAIKTLKHYHAALKTRDKEDVYRWLNSRSALILNKGSFSDSNMQREANNLDRCFKAKARIEGQHAVVYFNRESPSTCNPYFMEYEKGAWRIDLYYMSQAIRFNRKNEWTVKKGVSHPYTFAFEETK